VRGEGVHELLRCARRRGGGRHAGRRGATASVPVVGRDSGMGRSGRCGGPGRSSGVPVGLGLRSSGESFFFFASEYVYFLVFLT